MKTLQTLSTLVFVALLAACAGLSPREAAPPIVFVHGNGDTAALWGPTLWRYETNGWPRDRLFAPDLPYPLARNDDAKPQPGRMSSSEARRTTASGRPTTCPATSSMAPRPSSRR